MFKSIFNFLKNIPFKRIFIFSLLASTRVGANFDRTPILSDNALSLPLRPDLNNFTNFINKESNGLISEKPSLSELAYNDYYDLTSYTMFQDFEADINQNFLENKDLTYFIPIIKDSAYSEKDKNLLLKLIDYYSNEENRDKIINKLNDNPPYLSTGSLRLFKTLTSNGYLPTKNLEAIKIVQGDLLPNGIVPLLYNYYEKFNYRLYHESIDKIKSNYIEIFKGMIDLGVNPNLKLLSTQNPNEDYSTILHVMTYYNQEEYVKKLLENGAKPNLLDSSGYKASHYAKTPEIRDFLKSKETKNPILDGLKYLWSLKQSTILIWGIISTIASAVTGSLLRNLKIRQAELIYKFNEHVFAGFDMKDTYFIYDSTNDELTLKVNEKKLNDTNILFIEKTSLPNFERQDYLKKAHRLIVSNKTIVEEMKKQLSVMGSESFGLIYLLTKEQYIIKKAKEINQRVKEAIVKEHSSYKDFIAKKESAKSITQTHGGEVKLIETNEKTETKKGNLTAKTKPEEKGTNDDKRSERTRKLLLEKNKKEKELAESEARHQEWLAKKEEEKKRKEADPKLKPGKEEIVEEKEIPNLKPGKEEIKEDNNELAQPNKARANELIKDIKAEAKYAYNNFKFTKEKSRAASLYSFITAIEKLEDLKELGGEQKVIVEKLIDLRSLKYLRNLIVKNYDQVDLNCIKKITDISDYLMATIDKIERALHGESVTQELNINKRVNSLVAIVNKKNDVAKLDELKQVTEDFINFGKMWKDSEYMDGTALRAAFFCLARIGNIRGEISEEFAKDNEKFFTEILSYDYKKARNKIFHGSADINTLHSLIKLLEQTKTSLYPTLVVNIGDLRKAQEVKEQVPNDFVPKFMGL
jgi:uncharacterized protein with HEPN domain